MSDHSVFAPSERCADGVAHSGHPGWDIERDVIRGRGFDGGHKFLPDGLSLLDRMRCLSAAQARRLSQIQGRTYANMVALLERFINAKALRISQDHWLGDQAAFEAFVRCSHDEIRHQALFTRIERMMAAGMPPGYRFGAESDLLARAVLGASAWAARGLACHIGLCTQLHYRHSLPSDPSLSPLIKDVLRFHWQDEMQHALLDELEWRREDHRLGDLPRDGVVRELIDLLFAVDRVVQQQAQADAAFFLATEGAAISTRQTQWLNAGLLSAYRWQYLLCGLQDERFHQVLSTLLAPMQLERLRIATVPLFTPLI